MASSLLIPLTLLSLLLITTDVATSTTEIGVCWGQKPEDSLSSTCATNLYKKVVIQYLWNIGNGQTPSLNLGSHCNNAGCSSLAEEIEFCQSQGIQVLLSLGGDTNLSSVTDAKDVAQYLYYSFLGGRAEQYTRPLGNATLDGISFEVKGGGNKYWGELASSLKNFNNLENNTRRVSVAASPMCPYPDYYLGDAIATGVFDFVWIEFFDNPTCQYDPESNSADGIIGAWKKWTANQNAQETKYYLGLPASPEVVYDGGYIPPQTLYDQVIKEIESDAAYGGVMLWTRYEDMSSNYSKNLTEITNNAVTSTIEIGVCWGQKPEDSLNSTCATKLYKKVVIQYLWNIGNGQTPSLNLGDHCTNAGCSSLAEEIEFCQSQGIQVLLSLGGNTNLSSVTDAKDVAQYLYYSFLGGKAEQYTRPLGNAILDGISFEVKGGSNKYWDVLASSLKNFNSAETNPRTVTVAASPMCPYPDYYLGDAVNAGVFDFVWIEFFDNPTCQYDPTSNSAEGIIGAWKKWTANQNTQETKYYLGLPASPEVVYDGGYIAPQTLYDLVIKEIKSDAAYGGVMLWTRYEDMSSHYSKNLTEIANNVVTLRTRKHGYHYKWGFLKTVVEAVAK